MIRKTRSTPRHLRTRQRKKIYLSEVAGVAANEAFTAATLMYDSNDVGTLEAYRDAVVATKQWIKSAKAALKSAQQTEDMEAIGAAEEGLKLTTAKAEESKQGVDQLEAVASLAAAAQAKIIQENETKAAVPDKEIQEAINGTTETEHVNILTPDEKMGERSDSDDEKTREELPAKK